MTDREALEFVRDRLVTVVDNLVRFPENSPRIPGVLEVLIEALNARLDKRD